MSDTDLALVQPQPRQLQPAGRAPAFRFQPTTLGEAREMALIIAGSNLCPTAYREKPADVLIAYEHGAALGLSWMQALSNIAVINGRPGIYGDLIPALILATGECERFHSPMPSAAEQEAVCIIKRKGYPDEFKTTFSVDDAKKANLWGKSGPWSLYPKRMLQMRARAFCARDAFPDKLMGLGIVEELEDYPPIVGHVVSSEAVQVPDAFERLPEALRDKIEQAFAAINLSPGLRRAKLNEFLLADGVAIEDGAQALLDWCRDEFAKQKTGKPRAKKGDGNGKATDATAGTEARPQDPSPVGPAAAVGERSAVGGNQPLSQPPEPTGHPDGVRAGQTSLGSPTLSGPPAAAKPNDDSLF